MEKYLHGMNERPKNNEIVIGFTKDNKTRLFQMSDLSWSCVKPLIKSWAYTKEMVEDVAFALKYVKAYNSLKKEVANTNNEELISKIRSIEAEIIAL